MFVSLQLHLWRLLFIRALQHCSGRDAFPTGHCCSAKQARSMLVSLQIHLWRLLTQHKCSSAPPRAKCIPNCPVLLCKTGSQHACVTAVTSSSYVSSNNGFRHCHGSFWREFQMVKVCCCERGSGNGPFGSTDITSSIGQ